MHYQHGLRPGALPERNEDHRIVPAAIAVAYVIEDAHYLPFEWRAELCFARNQLFNQYPLRQGIDAGEIAVDKSLVDHRHADASRSVLLGEAAPLDDTHSEGFEVFGSYHLKSGARSRGRIDYGPARNRERHAESCALDRHPHGNRRHLDAGHGFDLLQQSAVVGGHLLSAGKAALRHGQTKGEGALDAEAQIHAGQIPETA